MALDNYKAEYRELQKELAREFIKVLVKSLSYFLSEVKALMVF